MSLLIFFQNRGGTINISADDSGRGTDDVSIAASLFCSDTPFGSDACIIGIGSDEICLAADNGTTTCSTAATETVNSQDNVSVVVFITVDDTASGSDLGSVVASISSEDDAVGNDLASVTATILATDQGTGTDSGNVTVDVFVEDQTIALDETFINALISVVDAATSFDASALQVLAFDLGSGTDDASQAFLVAFPFTPPFPDFQGFERHAPESAFAPGTGESPFAHEQTHPVFTDNETEEGPFSSATSTTFAPGSNVPAFPTVDNGFPFARGDNTTFRRKKKSDTFAKSDDSPPFEKNPTKKRSFK